MESIRSTDSKLNNLPLPLSSFIGREREIADVKRLLSSARLVTLTGAGGCGKTRLALEVGAALFREIPMNDAPAEHVFNDGVWLVEMAVLADSGLVAQRVADTLDIVSQPGKPFASVIATALREKHLLLILDNCEHLIEACSRLTESLLQACAHLAVVATSREALNIAGETTYLVPSLTTPDPHDLPGPELLTHYEAARLFMERASTARPDFVLSGQNATAVGRICHQLDGIPLAIELAAARVKTLSPDEIAARLSDRFRLLSTGSRTALPRHQTLRAAIDWSHELLTKGEQTLFRRLAVFAGGWIIDMAEDVCAGDLDTESRVSRSDLLECLSQLVGKSMVQADPRARDTRYRMLETVRLYARERLVGAAEFAQVERRHFAAFARLAAEAEPKLRGPEQLQWLTRLEAEHDNLRAALACDAIEIPSRLQLAINLSWFWNLHSHLSEGRRWLHDLMEAYAAFQPAPVDALLVATARLAAGTLAYVQDDYPAACSLLEYAIVRFRESGDQRRLASALNYFGMSAYWQGRKDEARAVLHESVSLFRRIGDPWELAVSLHSLDLLAFDEQDNVTVQRLNEESQTLLRQTGDRWALSMPLGSLGIAAQDQGELRLAENYLLESLTIQREFSDRQGIAWTLQNLGSVALRSGDYVRAEALCGESLALYRALNNQGIMIGGALLELGRVALHRSAHAQAAAHFAEALAISKAIDDKPHLAEALRGLGRASLEQEDLSGAASYYWEAMLTRRLVGHRVAIAFSLQDFALLAAMQNKAEAATRLLAASQATEERVRELLYPMDRTAHDNAIHQLQAKLGPRFDVLWAEGRALTLEQAVAVAGQISVTTQGDLERAPATKSTLPAYPAGLTTREVEVLRLVATGLTNTQIAEKLVISPRTVNAHVRSIFGKLDVTTRTAAARFATENKLV